MWQEVAIYIVGVGVLAYISHWVYRTFLKKEKRDMPYSCSSCSGCNSTIKKGSTNKT